MKKLIFISALALMLLGCSAESNNDTPQADCNCGEVVECVNFYIPNAPFTVIKVKNNCTGEIRTIQLTGTQHLLNTQYCN